MDRPAADQASGRAGQAAKLSCSFGTPCKGETAAASGDYDAARGRTVLPKRQGHVAGGGTATWHRLLDSLEGITAVHGNEPDPDVIREVRPLYKNRF